MRIETSDNNRVVNVGSSDIWNSIYSTVEIRFGLFKRRIPLALQFFKTGSCDSKDAMETARQFNLMRDELSRYTPEKAVYDSRDLRKKAPWANNISSVITSCANLYTTTDGQDLLYEVVSILCYAGINGTSVAIAQ